MVATNFDYIYNRDLSDPYYINANLPAARSAYTGVDARDPLGDDGGVSCMRDSRQIGPCVTRLNNLPGNQVTAAYVIKNTNQNRSWDWAATIGKPLSHGVAFKGRIYLWRVTERHRAVLDGIILVG